MAGRKPGSKDASKRVPRFSLTKMTVEEKRAHIRARNKEWRDRRKNATAAVSSVLQRADSVQPHTPQVFDFCSPVQVDSTPAWTPEVQQLPAWPVQVDSMPAWTPEVQQLPAWPVQVDSMPAWTPEVQQHSEALSDMNAAFLFSAEHEPWVAPADAQMQQDLNPSGSHQHIQAFPSSTPYSNTVDSGSWFVPQTESITSPDFGWYDFGSNVPQFSPSFESGNDSFSPNFTGTSFGCGFPS